MKNQIANSLFVLHLSYLHLHLKNVVYFKIDSKSIWVFSKTRTLRINIIHDREFGECLAITDVNMNICQLYFSTDSPKEILIEVKQILGI